jgi:hypothetical protein
MAHAEMDEYAEKFIRQTLSELEKNVAKVYGVDDAKGLERIKNHPFLAKYRNSYESDLAAVARTIAFERHVEAEEQRKQQSRKERNYGSW